MPVPKARPASAAPARLNLFAPLQALPRSVRPFPDETAESYLDRLALANRLDTCDLRAYLAGDKRTQRAPIDTAALAVLAGLPEEALRRAVPELSSPAQLADSPWILGRARPHGAAKGLACRRCAATRGATRIVRWQTHENVLCLRHRLWTYVRHHGLRAQLDLRNHAEIIEANRRHRRLIRRLGRSAAHFAFQEARRICAEWREERGIRLPGLEERLDSLSCRHNLWAGDPAGEAALYPHAVALTRLLASPAWAGPLLEENPSRMVSLSEETLQQIDAKISRHRPGFTASMHWDEIQLLREAEFLVGRPGTRRFVAEIRHTVAPRFAWLPLTYYGKSEPLAEWVRDRARARESAHGDCRHSPPPSEVYTTAHISEPR